MHAECPKFSKDMLIYGTYGVLVKKVAAAINYLENAMIIFKCILRTYHASVFDSVILQQGPGASCTEHRNEPFCSAKSGGFDQLKSINCIEILL
jgi:hypothetical protein